MSGRRGRPRGRTLLIVVVALAAGAGIGAWVASEPRPLTADTLPVHEADVARGEILFWAGGCYSCHAAADAPKGDDPFGPPLPAKPELGGGKPFVTPAGTFYPPNISPDRTAGIGNWSTIDFVNAMKRGLAPDGSHLYPAFPYTSYQHMSFADLIDLKAFLDTLPAVATPNRPHQIAFPFSIRRGLGLWKLVFFGGGADAPAPAMSAEAARGAVLVNGPGHCAECHTPRQLFGAFGLAFLDDVTGLGLFGAGDRARNLSGAPNPSGKGKAAPNITPGTGGIGNKTVDNLVNTVELGGGNMGAEMAEVRANLAMLGQLSPDDLKAIFVYLKQLPPLESSVAGRSASAH